MKASDQVEAMLAVADVLADRAQPLPPATMAMFAAHLRLILRDVRQLETGAPPPGHAAAVVRFPGERR